MREDEETLPEALRALRDGAHAVAEKNALGPSWLNYLTQLLMYDQMMLPRGTLWRHYRPLHIYVQICTVEDPWTALGNFSNAWYDYARDMRATLVREPLAEPEYDTEHTRRWGAFCAASVEFLCDRYGVPCPKWVHNPRYLLATPWWHTRHPDSTSLRERLVRETPEPFARRNIFGGNRLYQNKYEISAWVQEARAKGITDQAKSGATLSRKKSASMARKRGEKSTDLS